MYNLFYFYLNPITQSLGAKMVKSNIQLDDCLNHDLPIEVQNDPTFRGLFMRLTNGERFYSQIIIQKRFNAPDREPISI